MSDADTAPEPVPVPQPHEPITKVFIGNLAFRTTDQDLQALFQECGKMYALQNTEPAHSSSKAGVIITRGRRSLGYGFVEFVNPEDAIKSVEMMNKRDFLGRPLKVELAKDPGERPDRFERTDEDKDKDAHHSGKNTNTESSPVSTCPQTSSQESQGTQVTSDPVEDQASTQAGTEASPPDTSGKAPAAAKKKRKPKRKPKAPAGQ